MYIVFLQFLFIVAKARCPHRNRSQRGKKEEVRGRNVCFSENRFINRAIPEATHAVDRQDPDAHVDPSSPIHTSTSSLPITSNITAPLTCTTPSTSLSYSTPTSQALSCHSQGEEFKIVEDEQTFEKNNFKNEAEHQGTQKGEIH